MTDVEGSQSENPPKSRKLLIDGITTFSILSTFLSLLAYTFWDAFYFELEMTVEQAGLSPVTIATRAGIGALAFACFGILAASIIAISAAAALVIPILSSDWLLTKVQQWVRSMFQPSLANMAVYGVILMIAILFVNIPNRHFPRDLFVFGLTIAISILMAVGHFLGPRIAWGYIILAATLTALFTAQSLGSRSGEQLIKTGEATSLSVVLGFRAQVGVLNSSPGSPQSPKYSDRGVYMLLSTQDEIYTLLDICLHAVVRVPISAAAFHGSTYMVNNRALQCSKMKVAPSSRARVRYLNKSTEATSSSK